METSASSTKNTELPASFDWKLIKDESAQVNLNVVKQALIHFFWSREFEQASELLDIFSEKLLNQLVVLKEGDEPCIGDENEIMEFYECQEIASIGFDKQNWDKFYNDVVITENKLKKFEEMGKEGTVTVFGRRFENTQLLESLGESVIDLDFATLSQFIADITTWTKWSSGICNNDFINRINSTLSTMATEFAFPWKVPNRLAY